VIFLDSLSLEEKLHSVKKYLVFYSGDSLSHILCYGIISIWIQLYGRYLSDIPVIPLRTG
jgi:hypothetical protein